MAYQEDCLAGLQERLKVVHQDALRAARRDDQRVVRLERR